MNELMESITPIKVTLYPAPITVAMLLQVSFHHQGAGVGAGWGKVQAATINLQPIQPKLDHLNSMSGTVTATTNYNNSVISNDNVSVHDHNSDRSSHALQATLNLIVNNTAFQSQLNHVNSVIGQP